ncbi:MAG: hypothetical protein GY727_11795 [Gammaproteobacteria bacterium]|nr:hypothetical protein [Gammaproteobacteria bacterium]
MATSTQIKAALDEVAGKIINARQNLINSKNVFSVQVGVLSDIVTQYNDAITTIQGYGTEDSWEAYQKAELAKITVEFQALLADAQLAVADLANRTEF